MSKSKSDSSLDDKPKKTPGSYDKGHLVFLIFLYFGITSLLPFNAFITPGGFWTTFYAYNSSFMNYISFCYNLPAIFMSLVMVFWGRKWPIVLRVMLSLSLFLISLIIVPFIHMMFGIDENNSTNPPNQAANDAVTLIFILLAGVSNGIFFPTIIQMSTFYGGVYSQAMMEGNGIGGVIPVVINIITNLCVTDTQLMAEIYFIVAGVVVAFAFVLFFALYKVMFSRTKMQKEAPIACCSKYIPLGSEGATDESESGTCIVEDNMDGEIRKDPKADSQIEIEASKEKENDRELGDESVRTDEVTGDGSQNSNSTHALSPLEKDKNNDKFGRRSTKVIFKVLIMPELAVCFIFLVTLALFPATMMSMGFNEVIADSWKSIIIVGVFNLIDWLGRSLPKYKAINSAKWLSNPKLLFIYSMSRLIFIPLIVIPAVGIFTSTAYTVIIDILFAFTNGFISTMVMMKGTFLVENDIERQIGGTLMTVMLNLGLTLGSSLNLAFSALPLREM